MKEPSVDPKPSGEEGTAALPRLVAPVSHGLVPAKVIAQCVTRGLEAHQRIGQGRREARHGRRKKP